jgi:predicted RNA binding protein YcfA (HicA-like mRNA interferase family)
LSPKYPLLSSDKIATALKRCGFIQVSQKGSHLKLSRAGRVTIVPMHDEVARGTLKSILEQAGIDLDEFVNFL